VVEQDVNAATIQGAVTTAIQAAMREAGTAILEPTMDVQVQVPTKCVGDIVSLLCSHKRGSVKVRPAVSSGVLIVPGIRVSHEPVIAGVGAGHLVHRVSQQQVEHSRAGASS
jgi:hypothetical protein